MHMTTLRRIESGEQEPKLSEARAIADALGLTVEQLTIDPNTAGQLRAVWSTTARQKQSADRLVGALLEWDVATGTALGAIMEAAKAGVPLSELREPLDRVEATSDLDGVSYWALRDSESGPSAKDVHKLFREFKELNLNGEG